MQKKRFIPGPDGRPVRQVVARRADLVEVVSEDPGGGVRERRVAVSLRTWVGRVSEDVTVWTTHRRAVSALQSVAAALTSGGTARTSDLAQAAVEGLDEGHANTPLLKRTTVPRAEGLLLDADAFAEPTKAVAKLGPVDALKLLEQVEPGLARHLEAQMVEVVRPLREARVDRATVQKAHTAAVRLLVASLLTQRAANRAMMDGLLPAEGE